MPRADETRPEETRDDRAVHAGLTPRDERSRADEGTPRDERSRAAEGVARDERPRAPEGVAREGPDEREPARRRERRLFGDGLATPIRVERAPQLALLAAWATVLVLFLWFFPAFRLLLLGLLGAASLAAALRPVRDAIPGPRWGSATLAGLLPPILLIAIVAAISMLVGQQIASDIADWPQLRSDLDGLIQRAAAWVGIEQAPSITEIIDRGGQWLAGSAVNVIGAVGQVMSTILLALGLLFFGSLFMLGQRQETMLGPLAERFSPSAAARLSDALSELEPKLRRWVIATGISMLTVGVVSWIGYTLVGLRAAGAVAILAGFSEIVPTIGPAIAFLFAVLVGATQGMTTAIGVVVVYCVLQLIESYVLIPYVMREAVRMPPLVTLFSVIFWGQVFGIGGVLLAIPINLALWVLAAHFTRRQ